MTTRQARVLTVDTTKSTTYSEARAKVSASALKVGDQVGVAFTRPTAPPSGSSSSASTSSTKTPTASAVAIIVPSLAGQVVSKSGSTIVVKDVQGFERTIDITTATTYSEAGTSVSPSAVTENADVVAFGSVASDNTDLEATSVDIVGPAAGGKVTKVSGTTITVSPPQGGSALTITTTSSTLFRNDAAASSLSAIKVGDVLMAIGARASNGTLAATAIRFGSFSIGGARGTGPFGRGGWLGLAARAATGSNRAGTGGGPAGAGWGRTHGGFRTGSFGGPSGSSSPMVTTS
jgi:hypothetical protein